MQAQFTANSQPTQQQLQQLQQHYQQLPPQQQQYLPQQPPQQIPQPMPVQQIPQPKPRPNQADIVQDLLRRYPEPMSDLMKKHGGNQNAMLGELAVLMRSGQFGNPMVQPQQVQQQPQQQQQQYAQQLQQQQQQQQKIQQQQPPHIVGVNGPPSYPQQQQMGMRQPSQGHQRIPSDMSQMAGQGAQFQGGMSGYDAKQFEAVRRT
jgi:hypothetical protein